MDSASRYQGLFRHLRIFWPRYILGYGAVILISFSILVLSYSRGWFSFTFLALAALIICGYFITASLWSVHQVYDHETIGRLVQSMMTFDPKETVVDINLGDTSFAVWLSRFLTTGRVLAYDIYNPQLTSRKVLGRLRKLQARPPSDPRLSWRQTDLNLLPLPDKSVAVISLVEVLSEFWQEGDRHLLLAEIFRVLRPGGILILVERMRSANNLFLQGPDLLWLRAPAYWRGLISAANFEIAQSASHRDLITCTLVTVPKVEAIHDLSLMF